MSTEKPELAHPQRVDVSLRRSSTTSTLGDQPLWSAIRNRTDAIGFNRYNAFITNLIEGTSDDTEGAQAPAIEQVNTFARRPLIYGADAYHLLKFATHAFLACESGVAIKADSPSQEKEIALAEGNRSDEIIDYDVLVERLKTYLDSEIGGTKANMLPYMKRVVSALLGLNLQSERKSHLGAVLNRRLDSPSLLELIWAYWQEQGMLVQTTNAIALRFQNRRLGRNDPLAALELDPLRPLGNVLWGFVQDEVNRLSVVRRAHEYRHQYGLTIYGKAVQQVEPADNRSKFIEAFHNLLHRAAMFHHDDADTTLISDGFPLLNALKDVHVILAEGAHNQFSDMGTVSRAEFLLMQWMLARPELRVFLGGRAMVPYREPWMGQVDTMKKLQGWTDVSANHFRDLATFGEQLLLSVRYGDWIDVNDQEQARNWARSWRPELQGYMHSYRAVTGVDLTADVTDPRHATDRYLQPAMHMRNRLAAQQSSANGGRLTARAGALTERLELDQHLPARVRLRDRSAEE